MITMVNILTKITVTLTSRYSITILAVIVAIVVVVAPFFLSFFLSQRIAHNMVIMML